MLVAAVIVVAAVALAPVMRRLVREIPRVLEVLDRFGRELQPALVRVRDANEALRSRPTRS
jgi:hypothetical protein